MYIVSISRAHVEFSLQWDVPFTQNIIVLCSISYELKYHYNTEVDLQQFSRIPSFTTPLRPIKLQFPSNRIIEHNMPPGQHIEPDLIPNHNSKTIPTHISRFDQPHNAGSIQLQSHPSVNDHLCWHQRSSRHLVHLRPSLSLS